MNSLKRSFILHLDSLEIFEELTNEEIGVFMRSIFYFQKHNCLPDNLPPLMKIAMMPFINQFKRDNEKYNNISERNKENGRKGGRPKLNPEKPSGFSGFLNKPRKADNDNDNDNDNEKESEKDNDSFSSSSFKEKNIIKPSCIQNKDILCITNTNTLINNKTVLNDPIQTKEELLSHDNFKLVGEKYITLIPDTLKICYTNAELWEDYVCKMTSKDIILDWCTIINYIPPTEINMKLEGITKKHYKNANTDIKPLVFFTSTILKEIMSDLNIQSQNYKHQQDYFQEKQENALMIQEKIDNIGFDVFREKLYPLLTDRFYKGFENMNYWDDDTKEKEMDPLFLKVFESMNFDFEVKTGELLIFYSVKATNNFKDLWDKTRSKFDMKHYDFVFRKLFKKVFDVSIKHIRFEEVI